MQSVIPHHLEEEFMGGEGLFALLFESESPAKYDENNSLPPAHELDHLSKRRNEEHDSELSSMDMVSCEVLAPSLSYKDSPLQRQIL